MRARLVRSLPVTADLEIVPVDPHDDAQIADLHAVVDDANRYERPRPMTWTRLEMAVIHRQAPVATEMSAWLALEGGEPVGALEVERPLRDNLHLLFVGISVVPAARRRRVGSRLAQVAADVAREHGRTTLSAWVAGAPTDPSGAPLSDHPRPGEAFAAGCGLADKLTDLHRVLDLPVPTERLDALAGEAASHHTDYRLVQWVGPCPREYVEAYCALRSSIVSQAPMGDLDMEDEVWDERRLRADEQLLDQMQRTAYTTAAVAPDGDLVGHTMLVVAGTDPGMVYQWDTLVLPTHRGHQLGLALKVANLARVQREHPDRTVVHTFNAASNAAMVAVNDALGFRAVERMGEWQGPVPEAVGRTARLIEEAGALVATGDTTIDDVVVALTDKGRR